MSPAMIKLMMNLSKNYLANDEEPQAYQLELINCISSLRDKDDIRKLARVIALGSDEDLTNV